MYADKVDVARWLAHLLRAQLFRMLAENAAASVVLVAIKVCPIPLALCNIHIDAATASVTRDFHPAFGARPIRWVVIVRARSVYWANNPNIPGSSAGEPENRAAVIPPILQVAIALYPAALRKLAPFIPPIGMTAYGRLLP